MNPETNFEQTSVADPESNGALPDGSEHPAKPKRVMAGLVAIVMGLLLALAFLAWPKRPSRPPVAPLPARASAALPSGCTRNLVPDPAPAPASGCGHCASTASAGEAPAEACDMHRPSPQKPTSTDAQTQSARPGASHE